MSRAFGPGSSVMIFGSFSLVTCVATSCPPAYLLSVRRDRVTPDESYRTARSPGCVGPGFAAGSAARSPHRLARDVPLAALWPAVDQLFRTILRFQPGSPLEGL